MLRGLKIASGSIDVALQRDQDEVSSSCCRERRHQVMFKVLSSEATSRSRFTS